MKVAVSIPDPVFSDAEDLARRLKFSRSKLYARALGEFIANHEPDQLTEAMNAAVDAAGQQPDDFVREAGRRIAAHSEW